MRQKPRITKRLNEAGQPIDPKANQEYANKCGAAIKSIETGQQYKVKGA